MGRAESALTLRDWKRVTAGVITADAARASNPGRTMIKLSNLLNSNLPMWLIAAIGAGFVIRTGGSAFRRNQMQRRKDALDEIGMIIQHEKLRREAAGLDLQIDPAFYADFQAAAATRSTNPQKLIIAILLGAYVLLGTVLFANYIYENPSIDWSLVAATLAVSIVALALSCAGAITVNAKFKDVTLSAWAGLVGSLVTLLFLASIVSIAVSLRLISLG